MKRKETGHFITQTTQGEAVRAFVPAPLPPSPPIEWTAARLSAHQKASTAIGRLDGVTTLLPDPTVFLYSYVRKEAVLSSQIEGTQSSLSDLLAFENTQAPGLPVDDVVEVSNYVAALTHGMNRLDEGFPLCLRLVREVHRVLLAGGRGSNKQAGEFRRSQNWIGGSRPGNATFVPPPHEALPDGLRAWEAFLHGPLDPLTKAALAHVQFETLHPFLGGNGRVGRLLVSLMLRAEGVLHKPMLYLSLFFKQHRTAYYDLLQHVRETGDWEAWLDFFLQGVIETAGGAVATAQHLLALFTEDRKAIQDSRASAAVLRVHHHLQGHPLSSSQAICGAEGITPATANRALDHLRRLGIIREVTGGRRHRLFSYDAALTLLSEGTES
jgi:Fic family protein